MHTKTCERVCVIDLHWLRLTIYWLRSDWLVLFELSDCLKYYTVRRNVCVRNKFVWCYHVVFVKEEKFLSEN